MSKYIDELTELICDTVRTVFPNASLDDGYDVADEVIAKLPTIEVSEDCISKSWLKTELDKWSLEEGRKDAWDNWNKAIETLLEIIDDAPSVGPFTETVQRR